MSNASNRRRQDGGNPYVLSEDDLGTVRIRCDDHANRQTPSRRLWLGERILAPLDIEPDQQAAVSREEFEAFKTEMQAEIESLRDCNQQLREENEQLREQLQARKDGEDATVEWDSNKISDAVLVNSDGDRFPLGRWITAKNEDIDDLKGRVLDIERGEVDPGELLAEQATVDPSELLPIHQKYNTMTNVEPDQHGLSQNQEIAARLFPFLTDKATPWEGSLRLYSPKIEETIVDEFGDDPDLCTRMDVRNPNSATVQRVMDFIAEFSDGMIEKVSDDGKTNYLEWDRDEWESYTEHVEELTLGGDE